MNNRFIYVFPGQAKASWSTIEQLDLGTAIEIKSASSLKWKQLHISNPDIALTYAYGSAKISKTEILLFGGTNGTTYVFNTDTMTTSTEAKKTSKKPEVTIESMKDSKMCCNAWFGYESDFTQRIFGNYLYSVDAHIRNLHVYSIKDKVWNYSALSELGIN
jgi:hypothetical protein